jgi:hypothetical protein
LGQKVHYTHSAPNIREPNKKKSTFKQQPQYRGVKALGGVIDRENTSVLIFTNKNAEVTRQICTQFTRQRHKRQMGVQTKNTGKKGDTKVAQLSKTNCL